MNKHLKAFSLFICATFGCLNGMEPNDICTLPPQEKKTGKLLFIETGNNPRRAFKSFHSMAKSLGEKTTFKQGHEVDPKTLDDYSTIVFNLDHHLFMALLEAQKETGAKSHPYIALTQNLLQRVGALSDKKIIFSLPSSAITKKTEASQAVIDQLLKQSNSAPSEKSVSTITDFIAYFKEHDAQKKYLYATTLFAAKENTLSKESQEAQQRLKETQQMTGVTPLPTTVSANPKSIELAPLWPHGITWRTEQNNNTVLLTRDSHLSFRDIGENFFVSPLDQSTRDELTAIIYRMLQQFLIDRQGPATKIPFSLSSKNEKAARQELFTKRALRTYAPTHAWLKEEPVSCAWMDVRSFYGKGPESVDYILNSGLNVLWLDLTPEIFISVNGRGKDNRELFLNQVEEFTRHLKERAKVLQKPLPRLFMGTDITINFRTGVPNQPTVKVEVPAVTLYGKELSKVPSPFDVKDLWQTQVIDVFDIFVTEWQARIGNGLPLTGIFFDFEMYQAQDQASSYDGNLDFSDLAWHTFLKRQPQRNPTHIAQLITVDARVQYLVDTKQMQDYFDALGEEAHDIGKLVRKKIKARLPDAMIGAYAANIPAYWWYRGFMAALSRPEEPLIFGTFNTDFYSHADWLERQKIYMHHMQVLMLSKLRKPEDFKQIATILKNHDGIWFNRFSRLAQQDINHQTNIESSPLPANEIATEINKQLHPQNEAEVKE